MYATQLKFGRVRAGMDIVFLLELFKRQCPVFLCFVVLFFLETNVSNLIVRSAMAMSKDVFRTMLQQSEAGLQAVKMTISAELSDCILPADVGVFY